METIELLDNQRDYVVCVKPRGILSQSGAGRNLVALLEAQLDSPVYPVHRLDREVGGVMIFAKTPKGAAQLSRQLQQNQLKKEYLAVLLGRPPADSGALTDLLFHDRGRNKTYVVDRPRKGVKEARLCYQVLAEQDGQSLVQILLYTGRTHQIRAQFASRSLPLAGDGRYGGGSGTLALWAVRLRLLQPERTYVRLPQQLGPFAPAELPSLLCDL